MRGKICFDAYPSTHMADAVAVETSGSTLVLLYGDPRIECKLEDQVSMRPSKAGDVLSMQPGGWWQARVNGTNGTYEQVAVNGALAVYCPEGGEAYGHLYWPSVPNV